MNSAFCAFWLAGSEVNDKYYTSSEQKEENKMASRFASVTEDQILSINEAAVPKNTKIATTFGLTVFNGELLNHSKFKILTWKKLQ